MKTIGTLGKRTCKLGERVGGDCGADKQRGAYKGRKKSLADHQILALIDRAADGEAKSLLAKEFGISRETVYAYLRAPNA